MTRSYYVGINLLHSKRIHVMVMTVKVFKRSNHFSFHYTHKLTLKSTQRGKQFKDVLRTKVYLKTICDHEQWNCFHREYRACFPRSEG